ncbi:hypothetical protein WICMUC_001661 [Wickerhamomyces mucosus]|uniref:Uncharacterized protein n=1 Tax=Wickerhamomyces mucosus TaxID=1378264 RepID=A0A9P8PV23_9ASCO|nr:hypothetical protein WICMUC_001661 [Wickerhamomyces mucosus]
MKTSPTHLPEVIDSETSYKTSNDSSTPSYGSTVSFSRASTKISLSNLKTYEASFDVIKTNSPDSDQITSLASTSIFLTNWPDSQS